MHAVADRRAKPPLQRAHRQSHGLGDGRNGEFVGAEPADQLHGGCDILVVGGQCVGARADLDAQRRHHDEPSLAGVSLVQDGVHHPRSFKPESTRGGDDARQGRPGERTEDLVVVDAENRHIGRHRQPCQPAGRRDKPRIRIIGGEHADRTGQFPQPLHQSLGPPARQLLRAKVPRELVHMHGHVRLGGRGREHVTALPCPDPVGRTAERKLPQSERTQVFEGEPGNGGFIDVRLVHARGRGQCVEHIDHRHS